MTVTPNHAHLSRRRFLVGSGLAMAACATGCGGRVADLAVGSPGSSDHEALFYEKLERQMIRCHLCPHGCMIAPGKRGFCKVRENRAGVLLTLVYGRPVALHIDPVEKKPFFHVRPGTQAFSLATAGCNFTCQFCQNYDISQAAPEQVSAPNLGPDELVKQAKTANCGLMAYTYSEPVIFYEYMADCARAAKQAGLCRVMVSNGFITPEALTELVPLLTAVKIDLKGFSDTFYRETCGGRLQPVLDTLKLLKKLGIWTEVVTLVIPGLNDSEAELQRLSAWVATELGPQVPLHFSRFIPMYRMRNLPPTPYETLKTARALAMKEGCRYVYIGNAPGLGGENTICPACGQVLIERIGNRILSNRLENGACPACRAAIPGIWS
jgi:pyruvate formate lyase activating enzyme